jgi:hypothetical protein
MSACRGSMENVAERVRNLAKNRTMAEVVERMLDIEGEKQGFFDPGGRPSDRPDGVACFNALYLQTTRAVRDAIRSFEAQPFIERLVPVFAEFYFEAYDLGKAHACVSKAWAPLFERRASDFLCKRSGLSVKVGWGRGEGVNVRLRGRGRGRRSGSGRRRAPSSSCRCASRSSGRW